MHTQWGGKACRTLLNSFHIVGHARHQHSASESVISQLVSQIFTVYDIQAQQGSLPGKPAHVKKSGRFSTTDTVTAGPELKWPNEGFLGVNGKKKIPYDELTLPEWVVGQLYNVFHIQDPSLARQALLQVILAIRDATSLP